MDKQHIIDEIRRTSKDGKAIGQKLFLTETGIRAHEWHGKYWAKWGDALVEAGFGENEWQVAYDEADILEKLVDLTTRLGKYPTKAEMQLERRKDVGFPSPHPIRRLGSKKQIIEKLIGYCKQAGREDILAILRETPIVEDSKEHIEHDDSKQQLGYVYLLASAKKYKIGYLKAALSRTSVVSNMSPEGGEIIHLIRTDDMRGIEAYWHHRFAEKRGNGEWFSLSASDVAAFKKRKFM